MKSGAALGVYVGRFQPLHLAHLAVMREALEHVGELLVVLGSSRAARSARNPFTARERAAFVRAALGEAGERVRFALVRDFYDMARWAGAVREAAGAVAPQGAEIVLLGHEKDASSAYLREFPAWTFRPTKVRSDLSATSVREALWRQDWVEVEASVPPAVAAFLRGFAVTPEFRELREEAEVLRGWHASWQGSPQAPTFLAAHALISDPERVLLVRRTQGPGRDLLMLPGGPLRPGLTLRASLNQDLQAQTAFAPQTLPFARLFDHPDRSPLGREVAGVFREEVRTLPATPTTLPLHDALTRPEAFYADHHRMLEVLLGREELPPFELLPDPAGTLDGR